jgi:hypothetical protein
MFGAGGFNRLPFGWFWGSAMNLVRWFRKNNTKVMAIVVIVILFGFIGGGTLLEQLSRRRKETLAYFGPGKKITNFDLDEARRELHVLRMLRTDRLLRGLGLQGVVLGELLFSERSASSVMINGMKQMIRANQYRISDRQIGDIYKRSMPGEVYWLLLREETQLAGIMIPEVDVGRQLAQIMPQLFDGQGYLQIMGLLVEQSGIPENEILATFGKLLAVLFYSQTICSTEAVTTSQIMHMASWENETIDVEFVKLDSAVFAEAQEPPDEEKMVEHFDKYKNFFAGDISEDNPYGFGYKLADRVQLEYIAVKVDDISAIVTPPTYEDKWEYYKRHKKQFTETIPEDPNDPNSPLVEGIKTYAEVADTISEQLMQDKINSKAEYILQEAETLIEAKLQDASIDLVTASAEQFKQMAGDYKATAEQLSKKHGVKVYAGQTGLLTAADMQEDEYLSRLFITSYGQNPVRLTRIVFSIDELQATELGPFDIPRPRMYQNIGPAEDLVRQMMKETSGQIMAIVRVIKVAEACEPEAIDQTFSKSTLEFEQDQAQQGEEPTGSDQKSSQTQKIYSVREKVVEDLKKLAAIDTTKSKAKEFIDLVAEGDWDIAVDKFNELYGQKPRQDESDPNVFKLENSRGLQRISSRTLAMLAAQSQGNPGERLFVREAQKWLSVSQAKIERQLIDQLYSLVPQDSNTVDAAVTMEFKPNMSVYVIKNISVKRLSQEEYQKIKAMRLAREDDIQAQSLAVIHFSPENILKRMKFRPARVPKEPADANAPAGSEAAS